MLDDVIVKAEDGIPLMPELYAVPGDKVGNFFHPLYMI